MKIEEYQKALDEMVKSNTPAVNAVDLLDNLKADSAHTADLEKQIEKLKADNAQLTESNNKLYNKIFMTEQHKVPQEQQEQQEAPEKTPEQTFGELFDARFYPQKGDKN